MSADKSTMALEEGFDNMPRQNMESWRWTKTILFPNNHETELKTLEWDILNPDRIINLEIKNERRTTNI